ncbi:MAG: hypothetical protein IH598_02930 [Bacteroidales bacterium]|nr:hypothetical protein [Bacteroidales bacterium]
MKIISIFLLQFVFADLFLLAEVKIIGTPPVRNYDHSIVQAGTQNWMIDIGSSGLAYFANNDGVLEFDGLKWRKYPLPLRTVVRSIKATGDGRIYAGGYNELGFFEADSTGDLVFHSLYQLIPENLRDFGDIWKIHEAAGGIVFQTFTQLMIYRNDTLKVIEAPGMFHFSFMVNDQLFINDQMQGLFLLKDDQLVQLNGAGKLAGKLIWAMLPKGKSILIATADEGIFMWDNNSITEWATPVSERLKQFQVFCALPLDGATWAFGTIQNGVVICDTAGNLLQHININKGLQNNTVLSLQVDQFSNLWLGLDNGIDYVEINSPLTFFSTYNNLSSGYTAVMHQGRIYFGTNRGVFYHDWKSLIRGGTDQKFNLVPGTQGQVWALEVIDGTLFCGHNSGIFVINETRAEMVSNIQGGWSFIQPTGQKDIVICGTYTFLVKFERKNGKWSKGTQIKGFKESSKFLANADSQSIWISHGYKGVFRAHFNEAYDSIVRVDFFNRRNGFPSDKDISVFDIGSKPVFTTGKGIYRYSPETDSFVLDERLSNRLSRSDINILKEDTQGNIWYFTLDEVGVYRKKEDGNFAEVEIPFRELKGKFIKWFQFVYPHDEKNVFISTQSGFAHYTPNYSKDYQQPFKAFIRSMQILSGIDSLIYKGTPSGNHFTATLPFRYNHLQFEFSANDFENPDHLRFLTQLEGFEEDWLDWKNGSLRQFTNLSHGDYVFKVKAINIFGVESETATLTFTILPPWYLSKYAYAFYVILLILLILLFGKYMRYRIERARKAAEEEQRQLFIEREKQLQIDSLLAEQEVIKLRNEKLQSEKIQKDKELANTTMQIIQKSKSLTAIKNDLRKLMRELGKHPAVNQIHGINKKINRSIDSEKQWEVFESHFENVHEEFLKRLRKNYPDLSPRELKLCAYLRLNISSKEIATLMNISLRGVEISRYRLRKKLQLDHDTNLTDFILNY